MKISLSFLFENWRVKVLRETDYEPVISLRISLADVILTTSGVLFFTSFLTFFFVAYTPIREYLPGYTDPTLRQDLYTLQRQTDSLLKEMNRLNAWSRTVQEPFETVTE
jgi:hypothetical protein